jgi:hypothetical protein
MAELPSPASVTDSVATLAAFDILVESPIGGTYGIIPVLGLNRERTFESSSTSRIVSLVGSHRECAGRRRGCGHSEGEEGWETHFPLAIFEAEDGQSLESQKKQRKTTDTQGQYN